MEATINTSAPRMSTVDALWTLRQQKVVGDSLGRALDEVRKAERTGHPLMSFDEFLEQIESTTNH